MVPLLVDEAVQPEIRGGAVSSPALTVIIPTHNRAQLVCRAIRSVLSQTFRDFEIIVVDDASTDDTREAVSGLADPRIRLVRREKNGGAAASRNTGIAVARGQFVTFLDSDDEYLPTKLERQVHVLSNAAPEVGAVECGLKIRAKERVYISPPNLKGQSYEGFFGYERGVNVAPLLLRREVAVMLAFDELAALEDWDFMLRLLRVRKVAFVEDPLVIIHDPMGPRLSAAPNLMRGLEQVIRKYGPQLRDRPQVLARWHRRLAFFLVKRGDVREAHAQFLRAARLQPRSVVGWVLVATTLRGGGGFYRMHRLYAYIGRVKQRLRLMTGSTGVV